MKFQSAQQQLPSTSPLANHEVRGKNLKGPSKESFNWSTCFGWTVFHYQVTHQTGKLKFNHWPFSLSAASRDSRRNLAAPITNGILPKLTKLHISSISFHLLMWFLAASKQNDPAKTPKKNAELHTSLYLDLCNTATFSWIPK